MRRIHLTELEDQGWFPAGARDLLTDYVRSAFGLFQLPAQVLPYIHHVLEKTGDDRVVDLCSGGGGPWPILCNLIQDKILRSVCLTDRFPNLRAFEQAALDSNGRILFTTQPIDVRAIPCDILGVRTLFSCFHHFRPDEAKAILADAIHRQCGIAIFETTERSITCILPMLASPLLVLLITPFVRPFRLSRLLWTYIVPVVPAAAFIDGVVSCLRTYSLKELRELIGGVSGDLDYRWEIGKHTGGWRGISFIYVLGYPQR